MRSIVSGGGEEGPASSLPLFLEGGVTVGKKLPRPWDATWVVPVVRKSWKADLVRGLGLGLGGWLRRVRVRRVRVRVRRRRLPGQGDACLAHMRVQGVDAKG